MHFVLTGGTGFVGSEIVRQLLARGDRVSVLTRGNAKVAAGAETITWNPLERGAWMQAIDGADAVVHLAGKGLFDARWTDAHLEECRQSRVRSTALLAQAIAEAPRPPRAFVSCSAVGIYGTRHGAEVLGDPSPPGSDPSDPLVSMCVEWEAAAEPARAVTRIVHPRVGIVLGRGGGALAKLEAPFKAFVGGPLGDGTQYMPWIHLRDAAGGILHAVATESMQGAFNLSAPTPVTMNQLTEAMGRVMHRPSLFRVPELALKLALGRAAHTLLTGQRAVPEALLAAGYAFEFVELEAALRDILA